MQCDIVRVCFKSTEGDWMANLYPDRAPLTVQYFCKLLAANALNNTNIYRIVAQKNQSLSVKERIEVIQGGGKPPYRDDDFDFLEHEPTTQTGLLHKKYTLSMPRFKLNQVYKSFFITMDESPCLDYGGKRHPDKQGFATFGNIVSGFDTLGRIFSQSEESDMLLNPIKLISVSIDT
jgi:peptidyl-prolyl cis-trans isomerase A (cyclophilin A)